MKQKLIIFDCDGTLVDSEYLSACACAQALNVLGIEYTPESIHVEFMGVANSDMLDILNKRHSKLITLEDWDGCYIPAMMNGMDKYMRVLPESVAYVKALAVRDDLVLCVASNGNKTVVTEELKAGGYLDIFDVKDIFTASDVARPKPFPDLFLHAAKVKDFEPKNCIVIEDSPTGARAGLDAGMMVIGYVGLADNPVKQAESLRNIGVTKVVSSFTGLCI